MWWGRSQHCECKPLRSWQRGTACPGEPARGQPRGRGRPAAGLPGRLGLLPGGQSKGPDQSGESRPGMRSRMMAPDQHESCQSATSAQHSKQGVGEQVSRYLSTGRKSVGGSYLHSPAESSGLVDSSSTAGSSQGQAVVGCRVYKPE